MILLLANPKIGNTVKASLILNWNVPKLIGFKTDMKIIVKKAYKNAIIKVVIIFFLVKKLMLILLSLLFYILKFAY